MHIHKRNENMSPHKNLYISIHLINESMDKWMNENKMWQNSAMEYYSVIKRNEVLMCATMSMNFENIMLNGRS